LPLGQLLNLLLKTIIAQGPAFVGALTDIPEHLLINAQIKQPLVRYLPCWRTILPYLALYPLPA